MSDPKEDLVRQWLAKAREDLNSAKRLLEGEPPYLATTVYHCQQAAEKALKAYLAQQDQPIRKVHDVTSLVAECAELDASFGVLEEAAEILTPYGTAFRYPGDLMEPEPEEAFEAVELAARIMALVQDKLQ